MPRFETIQIVVALSLASLAALSSAAGSADTNVRAGVSVLTEPQATGSNTYTADGWRGPL